MKSKSLSVVLMVLALASLASVAHADEIPVSAKQRALQVEGDLNVLFQESLKAAALELDDDQKMAPFAFIKKADGNVGFFTSNEDVSKMSVNDQVAGIRKLLIELAASKQIVASVQVMYATVSKNERSNQGLIFEIEHSEGLSMMRFIPVVEVKDKSGKKTGEMIFEMEKLSSGSKTPIIFAKSIVAK